MILLIDHYDTFTFNLYQYLAQLGEIVLVRRQDKLSLQEIKELKPKALVLTSGPGREDRSGRSQEFIKSFYQSLPILGIGLAHQAIGWAFGAKVVRAPNVVHGKISKIIHRGTGIFTALPNPLEVMGYHSSVIEKGTLPQEFMILATSLEGEIMAIKHKKYPLYGLQFHPESIGTVGGGEILKNFLNEVKGGQKIENLS